VVVVDDGWRSGSLAAEIVARISEQAYFRLDAPPQRVCAAEVPMPYAGHLEQAALPQSTTIATAARWVLGHHG
jgi:pyruvate dehydrogenase E1 component beta subunit